MRRFVRLAALALSLVLLTLALGFYWASRLGEPQRRGSATLVGLTAPVDVLFDEWGVPFVRAGTIPDAMAALGWLHANDRLATMALGRLVVKGRLAEAVGEIGLESDLDHRRLRLAETAEAWADAMGPESRAAAEAYALGVNAWLTARRGDLPPTLRALGLEAEPWKPADSLGFALLMSVDLSFWQGRPEELRFRWLAELGEAATRELIGSDTGELDPAVSAMAARWPEASETISAPGAGKGAESLGGSNNWALASARTATGGPLLANDPHLGFQLPGIWYQVRISAPGYEVGGVTLPGSPGVVIGQNADLAWALTNVMLDDHDLFLEELDEAGRRVRRGEGWEPIERREERIAVAGGPAREIVVERTGIGPFLPADPTRGLPPRSLAWTAYYASDPLAAVLHLGRSTTVEEALGGIDSWVAPAQNLLLADRHGTVLRTVLGRFPARARGTGRLPRPAADASWHWQGLRPASDRPRHAIGPNGVLTTANHDHRTAAEAERFSGDFDIPARHLRIQELLASRSDWQAKDLLAVHTDVLSVLARRLTEALPAGLGGAAGRAAGHLRAWDGRLEADASGAALFALFERELVEATLADELDWEATSAFMQRAWAWRLAAGELEGFLDDRSTPEVEGREEIWSRALASAWAEAERLHGPDPEAWRYGSRHPWTLAHPMAALPVVGHLLFARGPFEQRGGASTVAAFGGAWVGDTQPVSYGPSMRWVADLLDPDAGRIVLPGGQSGHPFDTHFTDQLELYRRGGSRPFRYSRACFEAAARDRLRLRPEAVE